MLAVGPTVRFLAIVAALLSVTACDDDDENKTPSYKVTIYISDHIDINSDSVINVKPNGPFKKPRIEVHTPDDVDVIKVPRPKTKGTTYGFAPIALPAIIILILVAALIGGCFHPRRLNLQV